MPALEDLRDTQRARAKRTGSPWPQIDGRPWSQPDADVLGDVQRAWQAEAEAWLRNS